LLATLPESREHSKCEELPDDLAKLRDRVLSEITDYMQRTMSYAMDPKNIEREQQEKKECEG
jgi:hypothetical protein